MKLHQKRGFTLIEILIVVLIVAVLAAIALPQYQAFIVKARVNAYLPLVASIANAQEVYFLEHGRYAVDLRDLPIQLPADCVLAEAGSQRDGHTWKCGNYFYLDNETGGTTSAYGDILLEYCPNRNTSYSTCAPKRDFLIAFFLHHPAQKPLLASTKRCERKNSSSLGRKICLALKGIMDVIEV